MLEIVHTPVLLEETVRYIAPRGRDEMMIDATLGEGGHSYAFLSRFPDLSVLGIDADPSIQARARERLAGFGKRMRYHTGRAQDFFANYPVELRRPNTILADLGISSYHYEKSGRGFSFLGDEALDMRLDTSCGITAAELLARKSQEELADILYINAEERYSRRIARAIVEERRRCPIRTTGVLAEIVRRAVPASYRYGHIHPATRTFMALRIAVNNELLSLPALLEGAFAALEPGGRLGVISFHSLEDRIVKNFFRAKRSELTVLAGKGITPGEEEIKRNPPSRSARLRVAEKTMEAMPPGEASS